MCFLLLFFFFCLFIGDHIPGVLGLLQMLCSEPITCKAYALAIWAIFRGPRPRMILWIVWTITQNTQHHWESYRAAPQQRPRHAGDWTRVNSVQSLSLNPCTLFPASQNMLIFSPCETVKKLVDLNWEQMK